MSRATLETIGEAGDVMTRCESLLHLLREVHDRFDGTEDLTRAQELEVQDANWRWSESSKDYIDRAFEAAHEWLKQITEALSRHG